MQDVQVVRWPTELTRLAALRREGIPCVLLVAPGVSVPELKGTGEDWIRVPVDPLELKARISSLRAKVGHCPQPLVDEDGILRFGSSLTPLTATETVVVRFLVERMSKVAGRQELAARLSSAHRSTSRNALDLHIMRLRRKLLSVGLSLETIHGRGYLLNRMDT
ncbi:winged helix-turn-helix domain-containing protein [Streptomyces sp. SID3212]|uniref:winged helix-turn-helix domain-containing protein n=1 Tax=Streptomyces sp. SID1121 TaxID=3425888 RepID=UPI0023511F2B|nr:winged helix-turn-helix domain-containing protein [Streptomyces sp. SID3212]